MSELTNVSWNGRKSWSDVHHVPTKGKLAPEDAFRTILALEHRRAARSGCRFVLMLLDSREANGRGPTLTREITSILSDAIRETDLIGWYEQGAVLGVLFTELAESGNNAITQILCSRVVAALRGKLHSSLAAGVVLNLRALPEGADNGPDSVMNVALYPNIPAPQVRKYPDVQTAADPA